MSLLITFLRRLRYVCKGGAFRLQKGLYFVLTLLTWFHVQDYGDNVQIDGFDIDYGVKDRLFIIIYYLVSVF